MGLGWDSYRLLKEFIVPSSDDFKIIEGLWFSKSVAKG